MLRYVFRIFLNNIDILYMILRLLKCLYDLLFLSPFLLKSIVIFVVILSKNVLIVLDILLNMCLIVFVSVL